MTDTLLGETAELCFGTPTVLRNGATSIFSAFAEMEEKGLELLGGGGAESKRSEHFLCAGNSL